jgi:hypothetical protein
MLVRAARCMLAVFVPFLAWMVATLPLALPLHANELKYADQGPNWTEANRADFYVRDQGSRLVPFAWLKALKHPDGTGFLDDSLIRYGYLLNPNPPTGLPVGFGVADYTDETNNYHNVEWVGMTCAACHTRQIDVNGVSWRIDGGPAIADFQRFLDDLDKAFDRVRHDDAAFSDFASRVPNADLNQLRQDVRTWFEPFHTLMTNSLPDPPWGIGRLDAVSLIFNRVAGLEIGTPSRIIPDNMAKADAPVRYPFLWNAPKQDLTQWPGFSPNGDDVMALGRNVGEVLGVFGVFHPVVLFPPPLKVVDFLDRSSLNFQGLLQLEKPVKEIGAPKWPWDIDDHLADEGQKIFEKSCSRGCHERKAGLRRTCNPYTWETPLYDEVRTDDREYKILSRML